MILLLNKIRNVIKILVNYYILVNGDSKTPGTGNEVLSHWKNSPGMFPGRRVSFES